MRYINLGVILTSLHTTFLFR